MKFPPSYKIYNFIRNAKLKRTKTNQRVFKSYKKWVLVKYRKNKILVVYRDLENGIYINFIKEFDILKADMINLAKIIRAFENSDDEILKQYNITEYEIIPLDLNQKN